jgi:HD-like signal output (HDOD) protein/CheY-like chemotaxis protein
MQLELNKGSVLVVDDEPNFREALVRWLSSNGYLVQEAGSAEEAAAALEAGPVDVILLDLYLPGVHGSALLRELNRQEAGIPVIVISGTGKMDDVIDVLRNGAADFLKKPFTMQQLSDALDRVLDAQASPPLRANHAKGPLRVAPPRIEATPSTAAAASTQDPEVIFATLARRLKSCLTADDIKLPVLDPQVATLQSLASSEEGISQIIQLVERDPALSAGVFRVANSTYYSQHKRVSNLQQACVRLGNKTILGVAIEVALRRALKLDREPFRTVLAKMWNNVLTTARLASQLARATRPGEADDLYAAGLLHNVGELLMTFLLSRAVDDQLSAEAILEGLAGAVQEHHEWFGARFARSWNLPALATTLASRHHEGPPDEPGADRARRMLVLASWALAVKQGGAYLPGITASDPLPLLVEAGIDEARAATILGEICQVDS